MLADSHRTTIAWAAGLLAALLIALVLPLSVLAAAPDAVDDSTTVAEDDPATTVDVLVNDSDDDLDDITILGATNPPHGTVVIAGDDLSLTYRPDANYHGSDSFDYTITAGGETDIATVSVTVTSENDDPVAGADSTTVTEDVDKVVDVLADDTDIDGDPLEVVSVGGSQAKGSVSITNGGADVTYDPDANATGADSFTYTVGDGNGGQDTATVTVTITAVDDPPVAVNDVGVAVDEDTPKTILVLANDTDVDGGTKQVASVTQGAKGSVTNNGDDVTYVPALNATGTDSFTYTLTPGGDSATVNLTIDASNDPPTAVVDSFTIDEDITTDFDVLDNDEDVDGTPTISDPGDPSHGTVSVVGGEIRYEPDRDFHGADSFVYTITDGELTDTATVSVTIDSLNDPPTADDDEFGVAEEAPATSLAVLAGDGDPDGDTITITAKTNGTKGVVVITGGGTGLTYKPNANAFGADSFTYTISDGNGETATATVTMDIGGANDSPNAVNDATMTVPQGAGPRPLLVLTNDSDPDGDTLTITSRTNGAHGTVTITGGGTGIAYNPAGIYKGTDTFKYTVSDGHGGTDTATVLVTVVEDTVDPVVVAPRQVFLGQTVGTSTTKVRLSWSATDTGGTGVASYKVQVSVNGGAYSNVTTSTTKTSLDRTLTTGRSYRFRVRATDKEGNVSNYAYGPTFTTVRYSESTSRIVYVGTWPEKDTSKALGGHTRYGSTNTKRAVFTFTGYDVGWIVTRYTSSGKAEVYVDGVLARTIDLDRSSTAYRQLVFQAHFATLATHTVEIRPIGDGRVDIDGFVISR